MSPHTSYRGRAPEQLVLLACLLIAFYAGLGAQAATASRTLYADAANTGVQDGSSLHPYAALSDALAQTQAGAGDTVIVRDGTYAGPVSVGAGVTLASESGAAHAVIQGTTGDVNPLLKLGAGVVVRGFTLGAWDGTAIEIAAGAQAEVSNCIVYDCATGVQADAGAVLKCVNNTFYHNDLGIDAQANAHIEPLKNSILAVNTLAIRAADSAVIGSGYNAFYKNTTPYEGAFVPGDTDFVGNPLFVDADGLNFHLKHNSNLHGSGDPAPEDNNRDGSRNDVGADGGPHGVVDALAPAISVASTPPSAQGSAPLALYLDAGACTDEWGIASWEWDFGARGTVDFTDGNGVSVPVLYQQPGGYVVSLRVTNNAGLQSITRFPVRVGAPPQVVRMNPTPTVGAAPLTVSFSTDAVALSGGSLSYAWDFDGDGVVDSTESSPEHTYPAGTAPGLYHAHLILTDEEQVSTEILTPVTVAAAPVAVSALATPNQRTELDGKADVANITLTLPAGALNEKMPIGLSGVSSDTLALLPAGAVVALFDIAPTNTTLAEPATVQVSVPGGNVTQDGVKVLYWDAASHAWFSDGIRKIRVTPGTPALVSFETTHFNTFIVASATTATPAGPCFIATAAYGTPLGGDIDALRAVRDRFLLDSTLGTAFVDAYYRVSPPIADAVAAHPALATLVRLMLAPVIWMSRLALAAPWALLLPMGLAFWGFRAGFRRI